MRRLLLLSAAVLAMGAGEPKLDRGFDLPMCVSSTPAQLGALGTVARSRRVVEFPQIGDVQTVEIGQSMIARLNYTTYAEGIRLKTPLRFSGKPPETNRGPLVGSKHDFIVEVPAGRANIDEGISAYLPKPIYKAADATVRRLRDKAPYHQAVVALEPFGSRQLRITWGWQAGLWGSGPVDADYEIAYCGRWSEGDFRQDLIYSGVSGGVATVSYREFSNDLARPAFTQDVRYDLKDGTEVGFRGARFEILKATNTEITYRVLKTLG